MPIKTVTFKQNHVISWDDCVVLQSCGDLVVMAFPFHEDTPNFHLSIADAFNLRNALDEVLKQKFLPAPKGDI